LSSKKPSSQYGTSILRILSWIAHYNINPETPIVKILGQKIIIIVHSFHINPIKPSLGKLGKNPQNKTISLPPFLC
jgi:hypothetical protein